MPQQIIQSAIDTTLLTNIFKDISCKKPMLVCDRFILDSLLKAIIDDSKLPFAVFSEFSPNPLYEDVCKGVSLFKDEECDSVLAIGGGSAIDVAKCIKLFSKTDGNQSYLSQEFTDTGVPLIAIPTTAGTGSESTRFSVIYHKGEKQSVHHPSIVPNIAILDASLLKSLPIYQKKCTLLDALCQAIESWWSVNSTDESKEFSKNAIVGISANYRDYLFSDSKVARENIMLSSNLAGRAINITQTTAPHAMSYKLTSIYGIPHGHAVALSLPYVWEYMNRHLDKCIDVRGKDYLQDVFSQIAKAMCDSSVEDAVQHFRSIMDELEMTTPTACEKDIIILSSSVNVERLKNNPVALDADTLRDLYKSILL